MIALSDIEMLCGKEVSCRYDTIANCVRLEYGRFYEEADEAELFGDHIAEGRPSGFRFDGIADYASSNQEDLQLGCLESIDIQVGRCALKLSAAVPDLAGAVSFSFSDIAELTSERKKKNA